MATPIAQTFDSVYGKHAGAIPVVFLRTLAHFESGQNPAQVTPGSLATGLLQVVPVVLKDYNERHGVGWTAIDMTDPERNVTVGAELLNRIAKAYGANHPQSLTPAWKDRRWLELLVAGFNAGYSQIAGVQYVVDSLERAGIPPDRITIENVWQAAAKLPQASRNFANQAKLSYAKAVVARYLQEIGAAPAVGPGMVTIRTDYAQAWQTPERTENYPALLRKGTRVQLGAAKRIEKSPSVVLVPIRVAAGTPIHRIADTGDKAKDAEGAPGLPVFAGDLSSPADLWILARNLDESQPAAPPVAAAPPKASSGGSGIGVALAGAAAVGAVAIAGRRKRKRGPA